MKRYISLVLISIMILSALAFTACGGGGSSEDLSDSKYVGTWKAVSVVVGDESGELDGEFILVVNGDGTGTYEGDDGLNEFTWTPVNGGFKTKGDLKVTFKDDGDNIRAKILVADLIFEKQ